MQNCEKFRSRFAHGSFPSKAGLNKFRTTCPLLKKAIKNITTFSFRTNTRWYYIAFRSKPRKLVH